MPGIPQSFLLVAADIGLADLSEVNNQNEVVVPKVCRDLEAAIELMANVMSVPRRG
jgi:hypothetical protein